MLYHLSEEHEMLRQFVREFAESQLAPNAAEVDDKGAVSYTHLTLPTICSV